MSLTKTKNPRTYQKGISKSSHKLSDYVVGNLKNVIKEQNNLFLREPHTTSELMTHLCWISSIISKFEKDKEFVEWCSIQCQYVMKNKILK